MDDASLLKMATALKEAGRRMSLWFFIIPPAITVAAFIILPAFRGLLMFLPLVIGPMAWRWNWLWWITRGARPGYVEQLAATVVVTIIYSTALFTLFTFLTLFFPTH